MGETQAGSGGAVFKQIREWVGVAAMVLAALATYLNLADEKRFQERLFEPQFVERVGVIAVNAVKVDDLATKEDIERLERAIDNLRDDLGPVTAYLLRKGYIQ